VSGGACQLSTNPTNPTNMRCERLASADEPRARRSRAIVSQAPLERFLVRAVRGSVVGLAAALAGCSPGKGVTAVSAVATLDCSAGYAAVKAKIAGQAGLTRAPKEPGEPYDWYSSADQATSYVITEPGAPGHPAIVMEQAAGGRQAMAGCSYGDKAGYQQLIAYLKSLRGARAPQ